MKGGGNWLDVYLIRRYVSKAINIQYYDYHDFDIDGTESSFGDD